MSVHYSDVLSFQYYEYGQAFTGSYRQICYRIAREPLENVHFVPVDKREPAVLRAELWKGPLSSTKTQEEKLVRDFPFTEEGKEQAVDWINDNYTDMFG